MPTECAHTLSSGQKCQAPARTGSSFCHHHNPRPHLDPHPRETRESEPLMLPPLQDKCATSPKSFTQPASAASSALKPEHSSWV